MEEVQMSSDSPNPRDKKAFVARAGRALAAIFGSGERTASAASSLSFDPQVVRRMAQLEAELARLAESQHLARAERARMTEEMAWLRAAREPLAAGLAPAEPPAAAPEAPLAEIPVAADKP
jgi:hypothetical protein